jgi:hypothetical protein
LVDFPKGQPGQLKLWLQYQYNNRVAAERQGRGKAKAMAAKFPGSVDLAGTFLETVKPVRESLTDQLKTLKDLTPPFSPQYIVGTARSTQRRLPESWPTEEDLYQIIGAPPPPAVAKTSDPASKVIEALASAHEPLTVSELVVKTRLELTALLNTLRDVAQFGLVRRIEGEPVRFAATDEGMSVHQSGV